MSPARKTVVLACALLYGCAELHERRSDPPAEVGSEEATQEDQVPVETSDASELATVDASAPHAREPVQANSVESCAVRVFDPSTGPDAAGEPERCTYTIALRGVNPKYVRVTVNGTPRALTDPNGWAFEPDGGVATLLGASCDEARAGAVVRIQNECSLLPLI
jgi:hypothetical protein